MNLLRNLYKKTREKLMNREIIAYIVFGVLTTITNYVIYVIERNLFPEMNEDIANFIAIICSIIFAYFTNKIWVFKSRSFKPNVLLREIPLFFGGRAFTLILDLLLFRALRENLMINEYIAKALVSVIVIIINYIISKKGVFTKK